MSVAENKPMLSLADLDGLEDRLSRFDGVERFGHVTAVTGPVIRAAVPDVRMGEVCRIRRAHREDLLAEVVGFDRQDALMLPLGRLDDVAAKAKVIPTGAAATTAAGPGVRGRVLDALGEPVDGKGPIDGAIRMPLISPPPNPLQRARITQPLSTGVRAIDGMLSIGVGQRVGIFAAAGGGKSTLMAMMAKGAAVDVTVIALIGERGREVREFL
ncbi:MAG: EscN/YscN/HrcN family type III secretion system ATPase, partial [Phycisphaerae bacterium]